MVAIRVTATVESDGELHLTSLPCRRGDQVEAVVHILGSSPTTGVADRDTVRANALREFLNLARASSFRSSGKYPSRDELHDRA